MAMFDLSKHQTTLNAICKKEALNRLLPEVRSSVQLTEEVKMTRYHCGHIELTWNNGKRDIVTVLDLTDLDRGHWGVLMGEAETFNATAKIRCLEALNSIKLPTLKFE